MCKAHKKIPKCHAAVILPLASGHALIRTHLTQIKKKEVDTCWWCHSDRKQTSSYLFGGYKAWKCKLLALWKKIEKLIGNRWSRGT
jgi:hypothetical protein